MCRCGETGRRTRFGSELRQEVFKAIHLCGFKSRHRHHLYIGVRHQNVKLLLSFFYRYLTSVHPRVHNAIFLNGADTNIDI